MKISLYQRLALSLLVLFISIGGIFFWWSQNLERLSRNEAEQRLHISLATHLAQDNPLLKESIFDQQALQNMFHTLMILGPSFEFYFIDPNGKIITYSADPGKVKRQKISMSPLLQLIEQKKMLPIYGDDPRDPLGQKIFSVAPIYNNDNLQGYLYVIIGGEIYDSIFSGIHSNQQLAQSIGLVLGAIVFFFLVLLGLLRFLTLPLKELSSDIRAFRMAKFETSKVQLRSWPDANNNEIHELGQTFNDMAEQINAQLLQLQNNDQQRRELLTHLSHDLRTPLASLQGYLETIELKGRELSAEQHQRFIAIAFKNASQIKQLVDQIFELAHLESGQVAVNREAFPLGELIHDITAKFALKVKEKNIIMLIDPPSCNDFVVSDIGKLERVLTNLIDNAIRHSSENGLITLKITNIDEQKLNLEVIDNGTGINPAELPHVFEAGYRATDAIEDDQQHGGLGLAICQKLMALLQSEIHVNGQLGKGTTFSFSLEKML